MLFFMLFEGYLVKMWYIACIPDSGRPDRPTRPNTQPDPTESEQPDRPTLFEVGRGRRTNNQLRTALQVSTHFG